ncbi:MAG: DUF5063 domain-containing protein [Bacteroidaceae bacterium]|nr:DUF5063 domain-containing protein [Bacteroidaceae bacterium]
MKPEKEIYSHETLEFTTVAVSFCQTVEQASAQDVAAFVDRMLKLVPLLYLKAQLLPRADADTDELPGGQVTQADYDYVLTGIHMLLGEYNEYMEVADATDLCTEETRWCSLAEQLADVYQPVRNFLAVYQDATEEQMAAALVQLCEDFRDYWGQQLLDALRQLHRIQLKLRQEGNTYE